MAKEKLRYTTSGCVPDNYPAETYFGILTTENKEELEIPIMRPYHGPWGKPAQMFLFLPSDQYAPQKIDLVYLSIIEGVFYSIEKELDSTRIAKICRNIPKGNMDCLLVGMTPFGGIALWWTNEHKGILLEWVHANIINISMEDFHPTNPSLSIKDYCDFYINSTPLTRDNLKKNGLPPRDLFDNYMKQFTYRYIVFFEHWDEKKKEWRKTDVEEVNLIPEFDYIEETLFDGTHDKLHDGGLMNYHQAGKPKKLAVKWHINKSEYTAYLWFEDEEICKAFDRFYGAHPETKTDFMIRIDAEHNKYELALYRYGLKEPQVISESAYQLLVFKNKFEYFRSENYNQPKGAWIW